MTQNNTEFSDKVQSYTVRERAVNKLKKSSIIFPHRPTTPDEFKDENGNLKMPDDITVLNSSDLGRLLSCLSQLLQWYGAVLAGARVDRDSSERIKTFTESHVRMTIFQDKDLEKQFKAREDKEAYVNTNEEVIMAQTNFDAQKATCTLIEQLYADLDRSFRMVSREISRRTGEFSVESREFNIR